MKRIPMAGRILPGKADLFRRTLGAQWPQITAFLDENGVRNFSIWTVADLFFVYGELVCEDREAALKNGWKEIAQAFNECAISFGEPGSMRLMYHNFGIVRESKELIRHRMFVTKLKDGCAEEYKRRHDGLIEARGDGVTEGPESNFSIWNAQGYIFGYCEFDSTMETEETPQAHEATVQWETRQLEIMDWVTNDCDWLTGTYHEASRRIAWHN